ncbi:hypothetical protein FGG08_001825 [Glutinoglossum americanum]|uniref:Uncharacterized protein n=1 Tax=Glutinoglossum americanum TaxID=1670608 RepID=A0A9P8L2C5_9PEZI|nr:hypothetical protein FGG08_001825 [Glutinoglossum americanum]
MRGAFPLFLATAFGILNGVAIFQPAFADQQKEKLLQEQKETEVAPGDIPDPVETSITPSPTTESAPVQSQNKAERLPNEARFGGSLWSMMRFWGKGVSEIGEEAKSPTEGVPQDTKSGSNR